MTEEFAIQTFGLVKNYGKVEALRGLDLQVKRGEIFGFLGPNGAGKTTTIRCLLDAIRPTDGSAQVLGLNPQKDPVALQARVGYLPGELRLEENMRVKAALKLLNSLRRPHAPWAYVLELAERLDLDLERRFKNLSKGNKQKVGVIQAFMHKPELLILDEPTSGLDPLMQQEVHALVRDAHEEGATVFFSSHVLSEVEELAERVGIIRSGELVDVVEPETLKRRSLLRARIVFQKEVDVTALSKVQGVRNFAAEDGMSVSLEIEGEMDPFIKALAKFPVSRLETEVPSLEEVFLVHYK
ncbi:MAG TPA: ABC transporter ATP-binding protein [Anaerolineae bacterium]|nr:ABC transporter ATP-binding protein [Anaerolineae bacterium]